MIPPCKAAFNNMYFSVFGKAGPCWLQVNKTEPWSEANTIEDMWRGAEFQKIRNDLSAGKFEGRCGECKRNIDNGVWPLAKAYENFPINDNGYPSLMELELSNQCNLECLMCSGNLSSGIRKNREGKPPLPMAYRPGFIKQLRPFIPHLKELRFNGGEPLAQKIVFDVCAEVRELNPTLKINIATNGTVYNDRVRQLMEENNLHFNVSIDSLKPDRYAQIRVNGNLDKVLANFERFSKYCKEEDRELAVMFNPMRDNWDEVIDFVQFADDHECNLWFNTIRYPEYLALWNLPADQLRILHTTLEHAYSLYIQARPLSPNAHIADHFIRQQVRTWLLNQLEETPNVDGPNS